MSDGTGRRGEFLLDPEVTFLNHGSFGACPRAVFERYQEFQLELEHEPVLFLARGLEGMLAEARAALGEYVGADPDAGNCHKWQSHYSKDAVCARMSPRRA